MKRIFGILLAAIAACVLVSCSKDGEGSSYCKIKGEPHDITTAIFGEEYYDGGGRYTYKSFMFALVLDEGYVFSEEAGPSSFVALYFDFDNVDESFSLPDGTYMIDSNEELSGPADDMDVNVVIDGNELESITVPISVTVKKNGNRNYSISFSMADESGKPIEGHYSGPVQTPIVK